MNSMKRQNDRILKEELPRSVGAQYATGEQWRNNSRKNEGMEPKQKEHPAVDVTGDRSKVRCCKEQYCIGTWNVRSMNQGKLEVVKQEMTRVNVDVLGISELKWTGMGEFKSDNHYIYYCGQESHRRNPPDGAPEVEADECIAHVLREPVALLGRKFRPVLLLESCARPDDRVEVTARAHRVLMLGPGRRGCLLALLFRVPLCGDILLVRLADRWWALV